MKSLKNILIVLAALVIIFTLITIFLPSDYSIENNVEINSPVWVVYAQINDFKNWEKWDPWMSVDPKQIRLYSTPTSGKGANFTWESNNSNVGTGKLTMTDTKSYKNLMMNLEFGNKKVGEFSFDFGDKYGITEVKWTVKGKLSFFGRWSGVFMGNSEKKIYEQGLSQLKALCDKLPNANLTFSITENKPQFIAYINDSTQLDASSISHVFGKDLKEIAAFLQSNKIDIVGAPIAITRGMKNKIYFFDTGLPVSNTNFKSEGRIKLGITAGGKVLLIIQKGPYEQAGYSYKVIKEYMAKNNLKARGDSWECYVNNPAIVKPEDILTYIYFPIE